MSDILVYNNWDPLEEIWLGDTYPEHFYDDLKPQIRDSFCKVTEWTKEDLSAIEKKFKEFGVVVRRPTFKDKEHYIEPHLNKLIKPPICPRDENAVIGDKLYYTNYYGGVWEDIAKTYNTNNIQLQGDFLFSGASIVKLGQDIIFDYNINTSAPGKFQGYFEELYNIPKNLPSSLKQSHILFQHFTNFKNLVSPYLNDYRIHYSTNGGHADACFMPLRPGLFLATSYWKNYDLIFPDWKKLFIYQSTYMTEMKSKKLPINSFNTKIPYKWSIDILQYKKVFNQYIEKYCVDWVGDYTETYFEVNVVMIDEKNMVCIDTSGIHEPLFELLHKEGINVHVVPWRTRSFWDGGIHCITLDVRRKTSKQDYFPNRGDTGISSIFTQKFDNSKELFYNQYSEWLNNK